MAVSAIIVGGAVLAGTAYQTNAARQGARDARGQAEDAAAKQRESLAALQAEPTPAIPIADETAKMARRRSITAQMRRRGRSSTILTSDSTGGDALGA